MDRFIILEVDYGGFEIVERLSENRYRSYAKTWDFRLANLIRDTLEEWYKEKDGSRTSTAPTAFEATVSGSQ